MPGKGVSAQVLRYLDERIRLNVYMDDMSKDLGLTNAQIAHAIHHLRNSKGLLIETVTTGVYRYDPSKQPEEPKENGRPLFECIGESKQGKLVLQDENGELYVAEKL